MRTAAELMNVPDPAWPQLRAELAACPVPIEVLPVDGDAGRDCLQRIQVTARSRLGAIALHTGGLLVEHGWLRVLGGGSPARAVPSLADELDTSGQPPATVLVGYDVLGGRFEITGADPDAAGRPGGPGQVCYFAPDTLEWESLDIGHGVWLSWIAAGGTAEFYESLRWPGWEQETAGLNGAQGLSVIPFLWSAEAKRDLAATSRAVVPMAELFSLQAEFAQTLSQLAPGTPVQIKVRDSGAEPG